MNVTLTLTTPEDPEIHVVTFANVTSVRYTADSIMLDMFPGVQVRESRGVLSDRIHRYDLRVVLDVLVTV